MHILFSSTLRNISTVISAMHPAFFGACATALLFYSVNSQAETIEPVLTLSFSKQHQQLARADLLRHPAVRTITIPQDSTYRRAMKYRALPLLDILRDVHNVHTVQFKAKDGFVANIPAQLLSGAAEPWLAIEPALTPWPTLKPGGVSAGPFYLVWLHPEKSGITPEMWPYQITAISEVAPLSSRYPQILPSAALITDSAEYRGMQSYIANCAFCHQINGGGDAKLGPDLNRPFNPTEYFQTDFLRQYIRNPASVRDWPQLTMPGFPEKVLSDAQLEDLLIYLRHMADTRREK